MTPVKVKLAKILRLAVDRAATDGEKLAAVERLAAVVAAHDLDFDRVLNGGGDPSLTEKEKTAIYNDGFARGEKEGFARGCAERAPDASSAAPTTKTVGDNSDRLREILAAAEEAAEAGYLSAFEREFTSDMRERFMSWGRQMYVSPKQSAIVQRLEVKLRQTDFF